MAVKLISVTPDAEKIMAYCARVSNPKNQDNPDYAKLLKYCAKHGHWSVFEMADMTVEITTSRAIAAQLLRHRSFSFQEFSQRYAEATEFIPVKARRQDTKNRQNSIDDIKKYDQEWFQSTMEYMNQLSLDIYNKCLHLGIAKESARFFLPLNTKTKLYMKGSVRSWIHYLKVRLDESTQLEHREIAQKIEQIFNKEFPTIKEVINA